MEKIETSELTKKAQKEIEDFYSVDRFPTTVIAEKKGKGFKLYFVESDKMDLFKIQNAENIEKYMIVVD